MKTEQKKVINCLGNFVSCSILILLSSSFQSSIASLANEFCISVEEIFRFQNNFLTLDPRACYLAGCYLICRLHRLVLIFHSVLIAHHGFMRGYLLTFVERFCAFSGINIRGNHAKFLYDSIKDIQNFFV